MKIPFWNTKNEEVTLLECKFDDCSEIADQLYAEWHYYKTITKGKK